MKRYKIYKGDNLQSLKMIPDNSIDSIVTDPPYGLSFMGKKWDYDVPSVEFWREVYRVLKPGGHILSFGGTRTYHRMAVNIEDAGFEIRDQIMWIYGSGFPKSLNIGKAVDKMEGNEREVVGDNPNHRKTTGLLELGFQDGKESSVITKGNSEYEGWGTALKPANEPICLARKPLSEKSVAENVLKWKTGGINIDGCRIEGKYGSGENKVIEGKESCMMDKYIRSKSGMKNKIQVSNPEGRFPANIILECCCDEVIKGEEIKGNENYKWSNTESKSDIFSGRGKYTPRTEQPDIHTNSDCPCYMLDQQSGVTSGQIGMKRIKGQKQIFNESGSVIESQAFQNGKVDKGGASRFFYNAKVSKAERNMGLDEFEEKKKEFETTTRTNKETADKFGCERKGTARNTHPTVKPINLMAYLCRLITPENGIVLDPFMGSGSTGIAAQLEGFRFVGMEMDEEYIKIAESRIENWEKYKKFVK